LGSIIVYRKIFSCSRLQNSFADRTVKSDWPLVVNLLFIPAIVHKQMTVKYLKYVLDRESITLQAEG